MDKREVEQAAARKLQYEAAHTEKFRDSVKELFFLYLWSEERLIDELQATLEEYREALKEKGVIGGRQKGW